LLYILASKKRRMEFGAKKVSLKMIKKVAIQNCKN
jgi:hypothetical protein